MPQLHRSSLVVLCLSLAGLSEIALNPASAEPPPVQPAPTQPAPAPAPPKTKAPAAKPTGPTCKLDNAEVPRGGRLDVSGDKLGDAPLVRIAGRPARILERREGRISVQVAADSDGGAVTVLVDGKSIDCGTLTIIGKNN